MKKQPNIPNITTESAAPKVVSAIKFIVGTFVTKNKINHK
jgi:hypothetical protein